MGSRVVAETQDLRWLREGNTCTHIGGEREVRLTEDGRALPTGSGGWVRPDRGQAEWADEPVRSLYDALKPKLHYAYDRCADAYLRTPS